MMMMLLLMMTQQTQSFSSACTMCVCVLYNMCVFFVLRSSSVLILMSKSINNQRDCFRDDADAEQEHTLIS